KCLLSIWENKKDAEAVNRTDVAELADAEKWFIIAAESVKNIASGYYDLGAAYRKTVRRKSKTKEFYTLFLKKTTDSKDAEIKKMREIAQTYLDVAESMIKSSFEDGKKYYYAKNYEYAYEKFLLNFRHSNSTETALWIGRALENLKRYDVAQNWYLFASEEFPEAFYELAGMWYRIPISQVHWVAIKYLATFITLSENVDKFKDLREKSIKMKQTLESALTEFLSKPIEMPISQLRSNIGVYENLYETAEMFHKNPERKWAADKYFSAFTQLAGALPKYQEKYAKAKEIQKMLEKEYSEALSKAFEYLKKNEADKAIAEFIIVLNIKRTFPADYSTLLSLLEQQKRHSDLILWSDRAVSFYGDSTSGFKYRLFENYFYVNAFAHYHFGTKETGVSKLKTYLEKWENGKYAENVKKMLKNALQTKPE
ncbi:MAG: hypothetical protein KAR20_27790, partial [Candidatus Heimdallarchaeota archaeon]|nr:hypothetical protein [Candidatus Heimdallarchaeota archaeon]